MSRYNKQPTTIKVSSNYPAALTKPAFNTDEADGMFEVGTQLVPWSKTYFDVVSGIDDGQLYYNEKWVAKRLGLSVKTLQSWRDKGIGPAFRKFHSAVRYALADIQAFEKASRRTSTSDQGDGGSNA